MECAWNTGLVDGLFANALTQCWYLDWVCVYFFQYLPAIDESTHRETAP